APHARYTMGRNRVENHAPHGLRDVTAVAYQMDQAGAREIPAYLPQVPDVLRRLVPPAPCPLLGCIELEQCFHDADEVAAAQPSVALIHRYTQAPLFYGGVAKQGSDQPPPVAGLAQVSIGAGDAAEADVHVAF